MQHLAKFCLQTTFQSWILNIVSLHISPMSSSSHCTYPFQKQGEGWGHGFKIHQVHKLLPITKCFISNFGNVLTLGHLQLQLLQPLQKCSIHLGHVHGQVLFPYTLELLIQPVKIKRNPKKGSLKQFFPLPTQSNGNVTKISKILYIDIYIFK